MGTGLLPELLPLGAYFAIGTITDNDVAPDGLTVASVPDKVGEGDGPTDLSVTVGLDGTAQFTTDTPVTLEFIDRRAAVNNAIPGTDYTAEGLETSIPAGESSVTVTITFTPIDDNLVEL